MKNLFQVFVILIFNIITQPVMAIEDARNFDAVLANLISDGDKLTQNYSPQQAIATSDGFSRLYFDQFESSGLEFRLAAQQPKLTAHLELGFTSLIQAALRGQPQQQIRQQWAELRSNLTGVDTSELNSENWLGSFLQSLLILLREGVEAILLLSLLFALLTRSGNGDKIHLIWYGAISALLASIALAYGLHSLISSIGQTREMIEGFVLLVAAALLFYVSLWLISQRESQNWQKFLHQRIEQELERSNQFAVFLMAFIAVFREGAETILFYQALLIESQSFDNALLAGAAAAAALLCIFYFSLHKIIRLIRLDYFFKATALLLFALSVIFTGKGVMELQASGSLPVTAIEGMFLVPSIGIFPTVEALSAQLMVILAFSSLFFIYTQKTEN